MRALLLIYLVVPVTAFSALITVALPSSGVELLRVARSLASPQELRLTALHCWSEESYRAEAFENRSAHSPDSPLGPLLEAAGDLRVDPLCFVSSNVGEDILSVAHDRQVDLILMGWHSPMTHDTETSGPVQTVLQKAPGDVGLVLARHFRPWRRVLVPYFGGPHDRAALKLAGRMARHADTRVSVLHVVPPQRAEDTPRLGLSRLVEEEAFERIHLKIIEHEDPTEVAVQEAWKGYDLIVVGASDVWGLGPHLFSQHHQRLAFATPASLLVVHSGSTQISRTPALQHEAPLGSVR